MRGFLAAVTACAALAAMPAHAKAGLDMEGWTKISAPGGSAVVYAHPARDAPDGDKRVWTRMFLATPDDGARALVGLEEFDCDQQRYRTIQSTAFGDRGMRNNIGTSSTPSEWDYYAPQSIAYYAAQMVCPS
jgi:hypothetical protein